MFLADLLVVFAVTAVVVFAFGRLHVPSVVGLLASGLVVGPYGLSLVADIESVRTLAEVGIVVLLFTVGLEISLSRLLVMVPLMLHIGLPQVAVTTAIVTVATWWYLGTLPQAIFAGLLVAMSSTAIALKMLGDRGETGSPHGRIAVAVLLLQDLLVVAVMLAVPLLAASAGVAPHGVPNGAAAGHATSPFTASPAGVLTGLAVVAALLVTGRAAVPVVLHQVVRTRNRELFLITIVLICLGTAALTAQVGLSLALGAFLAGLMLSESEYGHQAFTEVLPFRDTLASLFFVSVGMLLDIRFLAANAGLVAVTVAAIVLAKTLATAVPAALAGFPPRTGLLAGAAIAQVGEFSFVLGARGVEVGLLDARDHQTFLAAAVATMAVTPLVSAALPAWLERLGRLPELDGWLREPAPDAGRTEVTGHVVIAGFGLNGRNLAAGLAECGVPHVVFDLNPQTVRTYLARGVDIRFGDCTRAAVLEHGGLLRARALVVAISDPASTRRSVSAARALAPGVRIIVRTEHAAEVDDLVALGADEVVPAEFETAVSIFERVLDLYDVPDATIDEFATRLRLENYGFLRSRPRRSSARPYGSESFGVCEVPPGGFAVGKSIGELRVRTATGATVIAVRRADGTVTNPGPAFVLETGDVASLVGTPEERQRGRDLLAWHGHARGTTPGSAGG
jgi:CPA2 family monovalent cation:H+ antiporter-2